MMSEGKTIGQLMEEMRAKAGAQNYHGHGYMDLQRFAEDTRHMIIFDVLTNDLAKMMTNSVRAIPYPIKRQCWRSSPHGRALQTLSISRTMALVVLALTVPDF